MNAPRSSSGRAFKRMAPWLGAVVVLQLVHLAAVATSFQDAPRLALVGDVAGWTVGLLAVAGTAAAALSFGAGDYLRRVWGLLTAGAVLSLVSTALRSYWMHAVPDVPFTESPLLPVRMGVVVLANVCTTFALVLLSRTYKQSGLQPPPSSRASLLWAVAAVAALAVGGPALVTAVGHLGQGFAATCTAVIALASTLADMTTILLVAPILRVAYMLRGGRLAWVWWAMGVSGAVWLFYDAREWLAPLLPGNPAEAVELLRTLRTSGLAMLGLAGWLQRSALMSAQRQSSPGVVVPTA
ncbi:hypothetical protein D7Y15_16030 [Corallococcus sp. AB030]|uniref:hypothetical protein n=1 Tax=Corallococcus TaxID=83461 RepID=UPI000EA06F07|nr:MULTISPECIES: hypothetical protein [unclassified Corallococcus]RKH18725.1 hypothetical protein D7V77_33695 [Corallococcus sp. CA041A]RKI13911.1 hypothetical protein D7Y15_16030 [Corallococcus sp. AB030]RUO92196.1 hypothetical protein D7Y11_15940 [Corallococcus sp. AB018]